MDFRGVDTASAKDTGRDEETMGWLEMVAGSGQLEHRPTRLGAQFSHGRPALAQAQDLQRSPLSLHLQHGAILQIC